MQIRTTFLLIFVSMLGLMTALLWSVYQVVDHQRAVAEAETRRYESYQLADELRQSSDDLTRMVRTYAVTEDPAYEGYFQRILAIRNGTGPRPEGYGGIYWDFVTATGEEPGSPGDAVSLQELMREQRFTADEFAKLREAQDRSDQLVSLEERAMAAAKGRFPDESGAFVVPGEPDLAMARALLHGPEYHRAKADIMAPIDEFLAMVESRTEAETMALREQGRELGQLAIGLMALSIALLGLSYVLIRTRVERPVRGLADAAHAIEARDYTTRVKVTTRDELGLLGGAFNSMTAAIERDIEERVKIAGALSDAREAAETANRAKSAFLASMSHELRTPMNAILGYSEMLIEEAEDTGQDDFVPDLQKIHAAGKHLLSLINDVLDLSKIEAGKVELHVETFDIREVLGAAEATIAPLAAKNGNELVLDGPSEPGQMRADITKLRQSLLNLMSNAAKFTKNGTVTLSTRVEDDRVRFAVQDTGIGIPADKLEHVFQEFTQADSSTTREFGGTGLGLAISRRFCQMMGGDIYVESEVGKGSCFTIELPLGVDAPAAPRVADGEARPARTGPSPVRAPHATKVLVIDDDEDARRLLARTLERDGFEVVTADSGEAGLELAREVGPSLITLDVMMPTMDGWSVLRALKSDAKLRHIPVVMVTIVGEAGRGFALGATDYLTKPVDRGMLVEAIRRYVGSDAALRVLVVEDDPMTRAILRRTLDEAGFVVEEAEHGAEGIARVRANPPAMVLLDLMMPVMDGFEFLTQLRSDPGNSGIPVLVLTAKELTSDEQQFLSTRAESVITKDADALDALVHRIRASLPMER